MDYRLLDKSVFARLGALLFLKAQLRGTLRRSLDAFVPEAAGPLGDPGLIASRVPFPTFERSAL